jgi:glycine oxidase
MKYTVVGEHLVTQLKCGRLLTGGNVVDGIVETPDFEMAARMAEAAAKLVTGLRATDFTHAWCGARPATPDGMPIIDLVPGASNGWIATGHYRNGVLLSPITGQRVAEWINLGKRPADLEPCRLDRFGPAS